MKLTKSKLKRIIKEELATLNEFGEGPEWEMVPDKHPAVEKLANEMEAIINDLGTFDKSSFTKAAAQLLGNYAGTKYEDAAWIIVDRRRSEGDSYGSEQKVQSYEASQDVDL